MVSGCAVVLELSNWPLVRLLGCLDVREFWASLRWQLSGGTLAVRTVGGGLRLDLFFPTASSV